MKNGNSTYAPTVNSSQIICNSNTMVTSDLSNKKHIDGRKDPELKVSQQMLLNHNLPIESG